MAGSATVYLKCVRNAEVQGEDVYIKDLGNVYCSDKIIQAKCSSIKAYHFGKNSPQRCVISSLELVKHMEDTCQGISVNVLGETDVLVERVDVKRNKGMRQWLKIALVCMVSFFGTAFTIMAYHNDIGINEVFTEVYRLVMAAEPDGPNVLEISYSIGLAAGIIVFFNHVGGRRLTKDPTPLEVAMRKYELDVDMTLIDTADREGKEKEPEGSGV